MATICMISPNPDAAGIGVRASLYVQALTAFVSAIRHVVLSRKPGRKAAVDEVVSDLVQGGGSVLLVGATLMISAFMQQKKQAGGLSPYHALILLHLGWIMVFTAIVPYSIALIQLPAAGDRSLAVHRKLTGMVAIYYVALTLLGAFGFWVFAESGMFSDGEGVCSSSTVFWWWGRIPYWTDAPFRRFWMAIYFISIIPLVNLVTLLALLAPFLLLLAFLRQGSKELSPFLSSARTEWATDTIAITSVIINALLITSIEKSVSANHVHPGESLWTLGQTYALLTAAYPVFGLLSKLHGDWKGLEREKATQDIELVRY